MAFTLVCNVPFIRLRQNYRLVSSSFALLLQTPCHDVWIGYSPTNMLYLCIDQELGNVNVQCLVMKPVSIKSYALMFQCIFGKATPSLK